MTRSVVIELVLVFEVVGRGGGIVGLPHLENRSEDIPSRRSGRATGDAKATATRDKRAMYVNCMMSVVN